MSDIGDAINRVRQKAQNEQTVLEMSELLLAKNLELESLRAEVASLKEERDEADRRAGAAERMQERDRKAAMARDSWLRKAKEQWGVDCNVSFDIVWAECLKLKYGAYALTQQLAAAKEQNAVLTLQVQDEPTEAMIDAGIAFDSKTAHLHHPNVEAYQGTEYGDSKDAWTRRYFAALYRAMRAAITPPNPVKD